MPEFFERFSISMDNYDPCRYFVPEGYDFFAFKRGKERRGKIPITLGMLYLAVEMKIWDTQELESVGFSPTPLYNCTSKVSLEVYNVNNKIELLIRAHLTRFCVSVRPLSISLLGSIVELPANVER